MSKYYSQQFTIAAQGSQDVAVSGDYFWLRGSQLQLNAQFDGGPLIPVTRGTVIKRKFQHVTVFNPSSTVSCVCNVTIGDGEPLNIPITDSNLVSSPDVSVGAGSLTQLFAGGLARSTLYLALDSAAAGPVRVGDSLASASRGVILKPGDPAMKVPGYNAVYAYNAGGSAVSVSMSACGTL